MKSSVFANFLLNTLVAILNLKRDIPFSKFFDAVSFLFDDFLYALKPINALR